jgi:hypothetical protein
MTSVRNALLSGMCFIPWLAGCAAPTWLAAAARTQTPGARLVYVTPFTNQGTVVLAIGDELLVELPTQNGGRWQLLRTVAPVLLGQPTTRRAGVVDPPVGQGIVYTFRANSVGVELVSFAPLPGGPYSSAGFPYNLRVEVAAADHPAGRP